MEINVFKNGGSLLEKVGRMWMYYWSLFFLFLLITIFSFSVFEWYTLVHAPEDRVEALKEEIAKSKEDTINMKQFESALKIMEERESSLTDVNVKSDIFY